MIQTLVNMAVIKYMWISRISKFFLWNIFIAGSILLLSSCIVVGYTSGQKTLPSKMKEHVVRDSSVKISELKNDGKVYVVDEDQIREYISSEDSVLIYLWVARCKAESCVTPALFESYCDRHGYKPVCILCYFDYPISFTRFDARHTPCLFLNVDNYSKDRVSRYVFEFQEHMTGIDDFVSNFILFENGKFSHFIQILE